ncbi:UDP-N-acetylmuramoyl-tripeptide--D-alanyl-D-alanine ligase [Kordiimonas sp. SCSIO 12610]|uniref:Mur ligase family protein n=1 Tax=Kordiimonas sp. SCSIO 12610 TaxID=2829597 RepID=UPI00210ADFF5|nr:UDP-N-acetylmuramoyl-tripeptide--D-alanyl-D-alanine ligase [Kordiimonas sp. SCSIO 12610]UTW55513.1 UDP-N-acetylmuramoyl-tripeptide--D-alanyl-D-alanine ligase [Kordiimonas sp. SCSIO 12610]
MISFDNLPFSLIVFAIGGPIIFWFLLERGLTLTKFFQQEEYDGPRFIKWLHNKKAYDIRASFWLILALFAGSLSQTTLLNKLSFVVWPFICVGLLHGIFISRQGRKISKKKLVLTTRVKRILSVYMLLSLALTVLIVIITSFAPEGSHFAINMSIDEFDIGLIAYDWRIAAFAGLLVLLIQGLPFILVSANKLLEPAEERVKAKFRQEAIDKFAALKPTIIAITGSFGKTSTKHILSHILSNAAPTLATPGSVNTDMGITRVIRESLTPEHQYFIVEMGAYGPGSIAKLCQLTPPNIAMISAVGAAHYERFKSLETVAKAKFEIAEACFNNGGKAIINQNGIPEHLLEDRLKHVKGPYLKVGNTNSDLAIKEITMDAGGLSVEIEVNDEQHILKAPLFGEHQGENIALAAACAHAIGMPWSTIKGALLSTPQIRHRLEVTKSVNNPTIIDDAYNSNPIGFAAALECLDVLKGENGRRILITPGMVELGEKHDAEHERLGKIAAKYCDIILAVTPNRIPSFLKGLEAANDGSVTVMTFDTQEAAETWARNNWKPEDAVLFENNLPDIYEADVTL